MATTAATRAPSTEMPEQVVLSGEDERALAEVLRTAIAEEAERLAASTRYAESAQGFRDLLERWKSAPSAGQMRDRELWRRFAAAREAFYEQRNRAYAERARERTRHRRAQGSADRGVRGARHLRRRARDRRCARAVDDRVEGRRARRTRSGAGALGALLGEPPRRLRPPPLHGRRARPPARRRTRRQARADRAGAGLDRAVRRHRRRARPGASDGRVEGRRQRRARRRRGALAGVPRSPRPGARAVARGPAAAPPRGRPAPRAAARAPARAALRARPSSRRSRRSAR